MANLAEEYMVHDAVYWPRTGFGANGQPTYGAPVDIRVRWDDTQRMTVGPNGTVFASQAVVMVGQDMAIGDRLRRGTASTLLPGKAAAQQPGSYEIRQWQKVDDTEGVDSVRIATL